MNEAPLTETAPLAAEKNYPRFDRWQRLEHSLLIVSFTVLAVTGLPQKFATAPISETIMGWMGGIETVRFIHRSAAILLMAESIYHIIAILYRITVLRSSMSMLPGVEDIRHVLQDIQFYFGRREEKARYGRYSYAEKAEYFALVWGTVIMVITGFMMWNPIAAARFLPGEFIPAAKAAHGGEALLAVLAIILWHFYHVHIRHPNRSMFTGVMSREEMLEEHPAELDDIESGRLPPPPTEEVVRRRERLYIPLAGVLTLVLAIGLYGFVTFEETAISTVPRGESAPAFFPQTPTPAPTLPPSPTPSEIRAESWNGGFEGLFRNRCGTCHGTTSVGGLSLASYEQALEGGTTGPAIVPGDPDASLLVEIQAQGNHPGQLTEEELAQIVSWIQTGAPEN